MPGFESPLNDIKVASPCPADWDAMYGDERKRFCGDCKLNVYNLSGMSRDEAESLITNFEGRLCIRFFQRADGTVITKDCPVGWAKVKQRTRLYATAVLSLMMSLFSGVFLVSLSSKPKNTVGKLVPFATPTPMPLMGAVASSRNTNSNSNTEQKVDQGTVMGNYVTPMKKKIISSREVKREIALDQNENT